MEEETDMAGTDQPYNDPTAYGNGPGDSVSDATENSAITHHTAAIGPRQIPYTATAGHLVTVDPSSSRPNAKIFYVSFTRDDPTTTDRPVTFFYNGGPGSSSVYLLLGSFAPMRLKTAMPSFTPPAPYTIEPNPDSLLDKSDLVFINPVGTGYSAAIAPKVNKDFWGVDQDAASLRQFIKRYLTRYDRWNSPKFLFGESYGTARSCVLAYLLHEDGVDLNGVTLLSSILDYSQAGNPVGLLPTLSADAWYHKKITVNPPPAGLLSLIDAVVPFAQTDYAKALAAFPNADTGIPPIVLTSWEGLNVADANAQGTLHFLTTLMRAEGKVLGAYDGRVLGVGTGIAAAVSPLSGHVEQLPQRWAPVHVHVLIHRPQRSGVRELGLRAHRPDRRPEGQGRQWQHRALHGLALNVDLKVVSANGYFDSVTPFSQTVTDLRAMPLSDPAVRKNLAIHYYPSGHMVYLDGDSRTALKADLAAFYDSTVSDRPAVQRIRALQVARRSRRA
jgi:carboxypeptidase C (cathepsin A)